MSTRSEALAARRAPASVRPGDARGPYERDRARVIHSAGFRRLQAKTQVLDVAQGDFYRTRLTHSMEVAQIGRGLLTHLRGRTGGDADGLPDPDLVEAVCLAHDLGHPPFGHDGETALNFCLVRDAMRRGVPVTDGFEGNGQTLRLVARLESHTAGYGLNLTRRTLLGILKYPRTFARSARTRWSADPAPLDLRPWQPPKCCLTVDEEVLEWILGPLSEADRAHLLSFDPPTEDRHAPPGPMSLDASLLEAADDIAYGTHDLEDGLTLGLLGRSAMSELDARCRTPWAQRLGLAGVCDRLADPARRKEGVGALVNALVTSASVRWPGDGLSREAAGRVFLTEEADALLDLLKNLVRHHVIGSTAVRTLRFRAGQMLVKLFDALASDPERLLPRAEAERLAREEPARVVADHLSALTDRSAVALHDRLYVPGAGAWGGLSP